MTYLGHITRILLLLSLAWSPLVPAQDEELLPHEEAFALSARVDGDSLVAEYRSEEHTSELQSQR